MSSVIAYTYEADFHCIDCTLKRAGEHGFCIDSTKPGTDENGVPEGAIDSEGNPIYPVFSTDELPCDLSEADGGYSPVVCGDCFAVIRGRCDVCEGAEPCSHDFDKLGKDLEDLGSQLGNATE